VERQPRTIDPATNDADGSAISRRRTPADGFLARRRATPHRQSVRCSRFGQALRFYLRSSGRLRVHQVYRGIRV